MKILIAGWYNLIYPICSAKKEFESLGHDVYFLPLLYYCQKFKGNKLYDSLISFIKNIDPDSILWWNWELDSNVINKIKLNTPNIVHCLFNWDHPFCLSEWELKSNRKILDKNIWDIAFCTSNNKLNSYTKTGSDEAYYLRMFADSKIHYPEIDDNYKCDISFVITNLYSDKEIFPDILVDRKSIIDKCIASNFVVHIYGPEFLSKLYPKQYKGFCHFLDNHKIFSNSKISFCSHVCNGHKYCNERVGTILASGGLLLVDKVDGLDEILTNNYDCIFIKDETKIIEQIKYIVNNYSQFEHIKKNSILTAKTKFSLNHWAKFIDRKINQYFIKKNFKLKSTIDTYQNGKISIVMSYYNRDKQLVRTLQSINDSAYDKSKIEVIIFDDKSDKEPLIINTAEYQYSIKLIYNEFDDFKKYINSCNSYNRAMRYITGEFVIIQNPECFHIGDVISHAVNKLKEDKNNYIAYACWSTGSDNLSKELFNVRKNPSAVKNIVDNRWPELVGYPPELKGWYNESSIIPHCYHFGVALSHEKLDIIGTFDTNYGTLLGFDDVELTSRILFQNSTNVIIPDHNYSLMVVHQDHAKGERPYSMFLKSRSKFHSLDVSRINSFNKVKHNIFSKIPRIVHFMWNGNLSYMAYISIKSFLEIHTTWRVYFHYLNNSYKQLHIKNFEQKATCITNSEYLEKLLEYPNFQILPVNNEILSKMGIVNPSDINEIHISDFYRYYLIYKYGGIWSDCDIIYQKNVEDIMERDYEIIGKHGIPDTIINRYNDANNYEYYAIGLIGGNKGNLLYKKLYTSSISILNSSPNISYQTIGSDLVKKIFENSSSEFIDSQSIINFPKEELYCLDHDNIDKIFVYEHFDKIVDKIAIHFYNGSILAKQYNNKMVTKFLESTKSTMDKILHKYNYDLDIIHDKLENTVAIVIDCSGYTDNKLKVLKFVIQTIKQTKISDYQIYLINCLVPISINAKIIREISDIDIKYKYLLFQSWKDIHVGDIVSDIYFSNISLNRAYNIHECNSIVNAKDFSWSNITEEHDKINLLYDKVDKKLTDPVVVFETNYLEYKYSRMLTYHELVEYTTNHHDVLNINTFIGYVQCFFIEYDENFIKI